MPLYLVGVLLCLSCTPEDKGGFSGGKTYSSGSDPDSPELDLSAGLAQWTQTFSSSSDGTIKVALALPDDASSMLIAAQLLDEDSGYVFVEQLYDPDMHSVTSYELWWDADEYLSSGFFPIADDVVFNWPVRSDDTPLSGGEWRLDLLALDEDNYLIQDAQVELTLQVKSDTDLSEGVVQVRIVLPQDLASDPSLVASIEEAVETWRDVWAQAGLYLSETWEESDLSSSMSGTSPDDPDWSDLSSGSDDQLVLFIGESFSPDGLYGIAGNIPGALTSTPRSVALLSWLAHAGSDGELSYGETLLMGETMAHELGHYMGLFHPVNMDASYEPGTFDALDDTAACTDWDTCVSELGHNMMYPYALCDSKDSYCRQDQITSDQAGVMHRYVGAL